MAKSVSKDASKILAAEKRIEKTEERILEEEQRILTTDQHIIDQIDQGKKDTRFLSRLYRHRFFVSIIVTVGVIFVWQGVEGLSKELPIVSTAAGALAVGLALLWLINKYASNES